MWLFSLIPHLIQEQSGVECGNRENSCSVSAHRPSPPQWVHTLNPSKLRVLPAAPPLSPKSLRTDNWIWETRSVESPISLLKNRNRTLNSKEIEIVFPQIHLNDGEKTNMPSMWLTDQQSTHISTPPLGAKKERHTVNSKTTSLTSLTEIGVAFCSGGKTYLPPIRMHRLS
jgi:hypothetical protein